MPLHQMTGSALFPQGKGIRVILNPCSHEGEWDSDFHREISERWPEAGDAYRTWVLGEDETPHLKGVQQVIQLEEDLLLSNMNVCTESGEAPDFQLLMQCLNALAEFAADAEEPVSLHFPADADAPYLTIHLPELEAFSENYELDLFIYQ